MPTLDDIEDLNGALESAFAAGVYAALANMPFLLPNDLQRATPRVELVVNILNALPNARRAFPLEGLSRDTRWNFNVKFTVITLPAAALPRNAGETDDQYRRRQNENFQLHEEMVSKLRAYASTAAQNSWADADHFPLHYLAERVREITALKRTKTDEGNHQTLLTYAGILAVRESAWRAFIAEQTVPPTHSEPLLDDAGILILDDAGQPILGD